MLGALEGGGEVGDSQSVFIIRLGFGFEKSLDFLPFFLRSRALRRRRTAGADSP